jgi:hypothetical protein
MQRVLDVGGSPPAALSLRFFLTAPLFAVLAGALLLWDGDAAFASRWSPAVLAATHLLTLGVLTMVMCGALLQLLPVVAGAAVPCAALSARMMHAPLSIGTLLLAAAFWRPAPLLFALAVPPLVLALGWLLAGCAAALWRAAPGPAAPMAGAVRTALAALALTLVAGAAMAAMLAWPRRAGLQSLANLHAMWGLLGWVGMLLIGVAWQVIPMFQVTALYPPLVTRALGLLVPLLLAAVTTAQLTGNALAPPLRALLFGAFALFAVVTLSLLARRKRPAPDSTTLFWRLSMASLLACVPAWYAPMDVAARPLLLGVLFLVGFASSAISGMLYKIVPFLLWHHWQEQGLGRPVPGIRQVIPEARAIVQFRCHLLAMTLLALAALWPAWLLRPAALALMGSSVLLGLNLLRAARCGLAADPRPQAGKPARTPAR